MILLCPKCRRRLRIPDEKIGPEGVRFRCKCGALLSYRKTSATPTGRQSTAPPSRPGSEVIPPVVSTPQGPDVKKQAPAHYPDPSSPGRAEARQTTNPPRSFSGRQRQSDPGLKGTPLQNLIAAAMIVLIFVCVGLRLWALSKARDIRPPDIVAANGNSVCIHFNKTLYMLSADGTLTRSINLADIGLDRKPADVEVLGNGDILVGDLSRREILRCGGQPVSCRRIGPAGNYRIAENFKFLADERKDLLFIADTDNNRLLVQDMEGRSLKEVDTPSCISRPNDMTYDSDGRLWLCDTGHSRLVSFEITDGKVVETSKTIPIAGIKKEDFPAPEKTKDPVADLKKLGDLWERMKQDIVCTRPLAATWDSNGNLWVSTSDGSMTMAGLKVFGHDGKRLKNIPLAEGSMPLVVARAGGNILVADSGLFDISSFSPGSDSPADFGDSRFRGELLRMKEELRKYDAIKSWAGAGTWLLAAGTLFLVIVLLYKRFSSRRAAPETTVVTARRPAKAVRRLSVKALAENEKRYPVEFTGSAREYFRIWIANAFLTIVTVGVYAAWAKVRTRKYFYRNTLLDGHAFDYTAEPKALLKGYLIVGGGIGLYYLARYLNPAYALVMATLFGLVLPFLIYKSLRFFTRNSAYRNVRFRFLGTLGESYRSYLFYAILIPFTLGLIIPYWAYLKKKYFFHNVAFGTTGNTYKGTHGPFYNTYIPAALAAAGIMFLGMMVISVLSAGVVGLSHPGKGSLPYVVLSVILPMYGFFVLVGTFLQQHLYAWTTNYCLHQSELGSIRFESTLDGRKLFWIRISNILLIILSCGLLIAWAKVRRMRYIAENISLVSAQDLNSFAAAVEPPESYYGEAATDFFDFEIGL